MSRGIGWRLFAALVGMVAVLIGYFWAHKPLDPALIFTLGGAVLDAFTAALIAAIAGGLGRRLLRTSADSLSRPEQIALESLLGLGILGWIVLLLGMIGLYKGLIFWVMLLLVGIFTLRSTFGWIRDVMGIFRRALRPETGWMRFLMLISSVMLLTALLFAFAPPTGFDALNYHLVGPQRYLAVGKITAYSDNHFLGFPQGAEILYGLAMGMFGRETAAAPLHFAFGLLGLLAIAGIVRRHADKTAAWLAVTLLVSGFSIWLLFGSAYIDLAVMAYCAAAFVAVVQWRSQNPHPLTPSPFHREGEQGRERYWLIVAGLMVGLAIGVKYTAGAFLLAMLVYLLWNAPRSFIRNALIVGLVALAAYVPWAIKGALLYQNPVYPYFFNGLNWDAGRSNTFSTAGMGLLSTGGGWQLVVMPFAATIFGVEKGDGFGFTAGPWLLTAPFLLLLGWRWLDKRGRALARDCALLSLPLLLFWMGMGAVTGIGVQTRLMMMAMPIVAAAAALGFYSIARWPRKPLDMGFVARALIALTLVFGTLDVMRYTVRAKVVPYLLAEFSVDDYRTENLGVFNVAMNRLAELPEGSTVRLMFEPRTYLCPPNVFCMGDILFDYWARPLQGGAAPDDVFRAWKEAGDDYLLVFNAGYDFNAKDPRFSRENVLFPDALKSWMTPLWSDDAGGYYTLYSWKP